MRAKDYIEKNKNSISHLEEVIQAITALYPLRSDEVATGEYHERILTADWRYQKYRYSAMDYELNKSIMAGQKPVFTYNPGEIDKDIAPQVRLELLQAVEQDKSFGYLFYLLASEQNRNPGRLFTYDCVPDREEIEKAIGFDWDDAKEHLATIESYPGKLAYLLERKTAWLQKYRDTDEDYSPTFAGNCRLEIKLIRELISLGQSCSCQPGHPEAKGDRPRRIINAGILKDYFTPAFRGMGNNINYFDTMIDELYTNRTAKEFGRIAYMIYTGKHMNSRKPATFSQWYSLFCEATGIEKVKGYKPGNLDTPSEALKKLFSYL
jgi:hypothetical protein